MEESTNNDFLTEAEATEFFGIFYNGAHHIPGFKPKKFGFGWYVNHDRGGISSFDFASMTKLLVMANALEWRFYRQLIVHLK